MGKFIETLSSDQSLYFDEYNSIFIEKDDNKIIINNNTPSMPIISPNKDKFAYISPFEWEQLGSLYLYNTTTSSSDLLIEPSESNIPKDAIWINNEYLLVIIGHAYGTVSTGGNLYLLNTTTREITLFRECSEEQQFTKIDLINDYLNVTVITYQDDIFNEYTESSFTISIDDILKK
ncbi:DUF4652 domain-containing protein [Alkaliphilus sp. MSJ-5]|uniref:DUF4652 domain-containing protein n=1 Tax=Alkaliphilus flagellatus TaxID=2841507 RepID=A0ABS6G8S4_9FIRM|nr:DUF4652 domain-containing protein [Alkaliphilus flagellatus]MBU5677791.1 DUF4652 domain-containing protein [Alkaliphilus flagellatus]